MDKAAIALATAEDNAAAIRKITKTLNSSAQFDCRISSDGNFGIVASDGQTIAIVFADDDYSGTLYFGDEGLACGGLPLIAVLPEREEQLCLDNAFWACALFIRGVNVTDVYE